MITAGLKCHQWTESIHKITVSICEDVNSHSVDLIKCGGGWRACVKYSSDNWNEGAGNASNPTALDTRRHLCTNKQAQNQKQSYTRPFKAFKTHSATISRSRKRAPQIVMSFFLMKLNAIVFHISQVCYNTSLSLQGKKHRTHLRSNKTTKSLHYLPGHMRKTWLLCGFCV